MKYGFFSFKQEKLNKEYLVYIDENDKQVVVTEVSDNNIFVQHKKYFDDSKFVGKLKKFIKIVHLQ